MAVKHAIGYEREKKGTNRAKKVFQCQYCEKKILTDVSLHY